MIIIQVFKPKIDILTLATSKMFKVSYMLRLALLPLQRTATKCRCIAWLLTCTMVPTGAPS